MKGCKSEGRPGKYEIGHQWAPETAECWEIFPLPTPNPLALNRCLDCRMEVCGLVA